MRSHIDDLFALPLPLPPTLLPPSPNPSRSDMMQVTWIMCSEGWGRTGWGTGWGAVIGSLIQRLDFSFTETELSTNGLIFGK